MIASRWADCCLLYVLGVFVLSLTFNLLNKNVCVCEWNYIKSNTGCIFVTANGISSANIDLWISLQSPIAKWSSDHTMII